MRDTEEGELEIVWPEDQTSDCLGFDAQEPEVESDTFYFEDGACYKILNHWSVINWCDYDADDTDLNDDVDMEDDGVIPGLYTHTQVLKLIDTERPTLTLQDTCFAVNANCVGEGISIWAGGADNGICASTGGDVHVDLPDGLPNGCASSHRVRWTVSDGCGNDTQGTSFFTIEDKKQPTPYMVNLSTALMEDGSVELWAKDFNAGSFDNCTPEDFLLYTFSDVVPYQLVDPSEEDPWYDVDGAASQNDYNNGNAELWNGELGTSAKVFTADDLAAAEANGGVVEQGIYVWDLCGNVDFALVNLKLIDNGGSANISGRVATEAGVGIEGVQMSVMSQQVGYPANTITTDNGVYTFQYFPMYNDYTIEGEKNDDWLNGVTTLDLVLIQRHILGLTELDSPYKLIAADASNDERISAIDLIQLRKLILGVYAELPSNDSWRFTDADASMNEENPWPFSEFVNVYDLEQDLTEDFVGVKIGDVNGSVTVSLVGENNMESRSANDLELDIKRTDLGQGEVKLEFSSANFKDIAGFQFTLEGSNISEITNVASGLITLDDSQVALSNNALAFSWNGTKGESFNDGTLFVS